MIRADPKDCIVRKQIDKIHFGFYTDQDVRGRSICEVTSPQALDQMGTALPNGLYDPRMGPSTPRSPPCPTCACQYLQCPGHFGHIELCVPVYHPLMFDKILTLLRIKCMNCHRLRAPARVLQVYQVKFELLEHGAYDRAAELDDFLSAAMKSRSAKDSVEGGGVLRAVTALEEALQDCRREISQRKAFGPHELSVVEQNLHREIQQELLSTCKNAKNCAHCGAHSPKIRQDSSNKFFQAPLPETYKRANDAEGIVLKPALQGSIQNTVEAESDEDENIDSENGAGQKTSRGDGGRDKYLHPAEVQAQLQRTWDSAPVVCGELFARQGPSVFFLQAIAVPPNRFRPPMGLGGMVVEHSQNFYLSKILTTNENVRDNFASNSEAIAYKHWIDLQTHVNCFMDSSKDPSLNDNSPIGIRQLLERKEGIFRKHMMGKRVDYACRSVISPDPYVGTNEIGLPRHFAATLTYPTPVTDINIQEMRTLVERGPDNYPGARWVEFPDRRVDLSKMDQHKREAVAARMLSHAKMGGKPAIVGRQLRDGDMVLMNRQPTLHKPGIMAHEVRVLYNPDQKTIRMHYANCNTYNADFDGDEMNCHFPQSDLGRAEAKFIAQTDLQFIAPTDGSPLRGLIQDHVVGGVQLTKKDTFLNREEYQQLLFAALASLPRLELIRSNADIELLPPALIKPRELWTGKQVISTLLNHLRKGNDRDGAHHEAFPGLSTERKTKTPAVAFGEANEEHRVLIRDGELLRGVLDKAAFGSTDFSLVHAVYEAYGPAKAGLLLNALGRLFTAYIQFYHGHSCRMEDLVLTAKSDDERRALVQRAYTVGSRAAQAWANSEGGKVPIEIKNEDRALKPYENASAAAKINRLLSGSEGKDNAAALDGFMMSKLNPLASDIVKTCLPKGLAVPFPKNSFGVMVTTGAKGSIVNQSQVTCALGQQALEGRRVPRLASGRTLPSFAPYDVNPRADGFVMDRFLTGVRPQEYYFHCMAGREGLVDTAVKTSRSGYLQRCLVKHLEELKVSYDFTVRNGEGGVVQFLYGEDGLDPTKASYLDCSEASFTYIARNHESLSRQNAALPGTSISMASDIAKRVQAINSGVVKFEVGDFVKARKLRTGSEWKHGALCLGWHDATIQKVRKNAVDIKYVNDGKTEKGVPLSIDMIGAKGLSNHCTIVKAASPDPLLASPDPSTRLGSYGGCISERVAEAATSALNENSRVKEAIKSVKLDKDAFGSLVAAKYGASLCAPGEAVGSIAAQGVGEPSTQMTLNTFHLAGAGANVTLGIPRLREIIMTASRDLKTPTMSAPLHSYVSDKEAVRLTRYFQRLNLNELIAGHHGITVVESLTESAAGNWERAYGVTLKLHPAERIMEAFDLTLEDVAAVVAKDFVPALSREMKLELRRSATEGEMNLEVEGGEATLYNRPKKSDEDMQEDTGRSNTADLFDDEEDDDAASVNQAGDEDGVTETRTQVDGYGEADEEEKIDDDASMSDADLISEDGGNEDIGDVDMVPASFINEVKVDKKRNCITIPALRVDPAARPLLMVGLVEKAAQKTIVRARHKIDQAFINTEEAGRGRCLQTAGINFTEMWELESIDHNRLMSNDIWAVRCAYGVEAARNNIVDQIRSVFGAYGIEVDARHLSLIADYMTYGGEYTAMNRIGMRDAMSSPFLQMSFETTAQFLTQAAMQTRSDAVKSPSANIVVGRPIRHGTGAFSLLAA